MQQGHLPGFDPPRELHHLFLALWPDEATRARMAAAAESLQPLASSGRWIKPHRYHLTLRFLGEHAELPPGLIERVEKAATAVRVPAFDLVLDMAGSFGASRIPCWLGCSQSPPALTALFDTLGSTLRAQGVRVQDNSRLVPHVTVLRDAHLPMHARLGSPVHWRIDRFVLIDSRIRPQAPYRILGDWPLD